MNRYIAQGLAADLVGGKRILFVGELQADAREALKQTDVLLIKADGRHRTVRANGEERIEHPSGGLIRFISGRSQSAARGFSFDIVVLPSHSDSEPYRPTLPSEWIRV